MITELLIDADVLCYKAGFALETREWVLVNYDTEESVVVKDKKHALELLKVFEGDYCELKQERKLKENSYTVGQIIKVLLNSIEIPATKRTLFITDTDIQNNFRKLVDPEYKVNRKKMEKPLLYNEAREVLLQKFSAQLVTGFEADDALGMAQRDDTCIVSIDKDLRMIPGHHYNLDTKEHFIADDPGHLELREKKLWGHGFKWFCAQMLMGDTADNVIGLDGYGPIKTFKVFSAVENEVGPLWKEVKARYVEQNREQDLIKNANLLWIWRSPEIRFHDYMGTNI